MARCVDVVRNGSAQHPVAVPLPSGGVERALGMLLKTTGRVLSIPVHSLLDEEGAEIGAEDLAELRPDARLFACSSPDEPFLRERPRRCQLFRVAGAGPIIDARTSRLGAWDDSHVVDTPHDTALARWHEGKVVAVPDHMSELRQVAADRLALAADVGSIRFRSAGSGLLIFETTAIADDELLLVETPTVESAVSDVRSLLGASTIGTTRSWGADPVQQRPGRECASSSRGRRQPGERATERRRTGDSEPSPPPGREPSPPPPAKAAAPAQGGEAVPAWRSPGWSRRQAAPVTTEEDDDDKAEDVAEAASTRRRGGRRDSKHNSGAGRGRPSSSMRRHETRRRGSTSSYSSSSLSPSEYADGPASDSSV